MKEKVCKEIREFLKEWSNEEVYFKNGSFYQGKYEICWCEGKNALIRFNIDMPIPLVKTICDFYEEV